MLLPLSDFALTSICSFLFPGVVISSATVSTTSTTVFWEPYFATMNMDMQASCCMVDQSGMCSNNNEVRITNGNFSVDGLQEFTNYYCRIAGFSAPFLVTTLSDSKYICCYSLQVEGCSVNLSSFSLPSLSPFPSRAFFPS